MNVRILMPRGHSAVYRQGLTGDIAPARTAKPQHGCRDLLRPAGAAHRNALRCFGVYVFVSFEHVSADLRIDQAGIDCIDTDAVPDILESGCARQADHAVL